MSPSIVARQSPSDRTAIGVRVAQRSQSITISIFKKPTKGAVQHPQSDAVGIAPLCRAVRP